MPPFRNITAFFPKSIRFYAIQPRYPSYIQFSSPFPNTIIKFVRSTFRVAIKFSKSLWPFSSSNAVFIKKIHFMCLIKSAVTHFLVFDCININRRLVRNRVVGCIDIIYFIKLNFYWTTFYIYICYCTYFVTILFVRINSTAD